MNKTCCKCKQVKTTSEFYKDSSRSDGLSSRCKNCKYGAPAETNRNEVARQNKVLAEYGIRNCSTCKVPKLISEDFYRGENRCKSCCVKRSVGYNREKKNGWPVEDYNSAYLEQEGKCAICNTWQEKLHGDHCHASGNQRKLLCNNCNLLLGHAKDRVEVLLAAAEYLIQHSDPVKLLEGGNPFV